MVLNEIHSEFVFEKKRCKLFIKREDLIHSTVSGNKFRKLKYNLLFAKENKHTHILTFGGAYSNHIAATAAAGEIEGFETIGIIRGEELGVDIHKTLSQNPTLLFAHKCGMKLVFISRETYREKDSDRFRESIKKTYNNPYIIPEGGTNELAVKGCQEILTKEDQKMDYICVPIGTAGTIGGVINSIVSYQKVIGFPALKGNWINQEVKKYAINDQWEVSHDYHFGGYAKVSEALVHFINDFKEKYDIPLDPLYTGKMMFGICDLINRGFFPENSRILAIHTGGLQGIAGMNMQLAKKKLPIITI